MNSVVISILALLTVGAIVLAVYLIREKYLEWKSGEKSYLPKDVKMAIDNHIKKLEEEIKEIEFKR